MDDFLLMTREMLMKTPYESTAKLTNQLIDYFGQVGDSPKIHPEVFSELILTIKGFQNESDPDINRV